jgi:hypothetical protein
MSDPIPEVVSALSSTGDTSPPPEQPPAPQIIEQPNLPQQTPATQQQPTGYNPAWNPVLEKLPESFRPAIIPHLQEWDKNFDSKLSEVQQRYEPYKQFVDNNVSASDIEVALKIAQEIDQNPEAFYKQMQDFFGYDAGQGQQQQQSPPSDDPNFSFDGIDSGDELLQNPKIQELLQNQQTLAQVILQQREQQQLEQHNRQIEADLAEIKQGNPNIDELMLFRIATGQGVDLKQAAQILDSYNQSLLTASRTPAPPVFNPAGGGVPAAQQPDPAKLNPKETKNLVAEILKAQLGNPTGG